MLLIAVLSVPVAVSASYRAATVNALMPYLFGAFVLAMLPEVLETLRQWLRLMLTRVIALATFVCLGGWFVYQDVSLLNDRLWLYVVLIPFFIATSAWFSICRAEGFVTFFALKLGISLIAMGALAAALALYPDDRWFLVRTPLLNHIRHINIEWVTASFLSLFYFRTAPRNAAYLWCLLFACFGYFALLSGGRGAVLALAVSVGLLLVFRRIQWSDHRLLTAMAAFCSGAGFVFLTGQDWLVSAQFGKLMAGSADVAASGRVEIWHDAWSRATESLPTFLCGMGPDAYLRLGISGRVSYLGGVYLMHPHNAILLWLIEFGLIGVACIMAAVSIVAIQAVRLLRKHGEMDLYAAVAALFLAYCFYSLTDAIAYHATALTNFVILAAYLVAASRGTDASRSVSASEDAPVA